MTNTNQTPPQTTSEHNEDVTAVKRIVSWRVTLWLLLMWVVLFHDISLVTIVSGVVVAVIIQLIFPMPHLGVFRSLHIGPLIVLIVRFIYDIFVSAVRVAYLVVTQKEVASYIVSVPMRIQSELYTTIVGDMCSLTPGTLVTGARMLPATIELHVFDAEAFGRREKIIEETQAIEARVVKAIGTKQERDIIARAEAADKRRRAQRDKILAQRPTTTKKPLEYDGYGDDKGDQS